MVFSKRKCLVVAASTTHAVNTRAFSTVRRMYLTRALTVGVLLFTLSSYGV